MPRSSAEQVANEISGLIDRGEWSTGSRIPPERLLAERFGAARNTVRSAVSQLERDGKVHRPNGRGVFVADQVETDLAATIKRIRGVSPRDMMEVRLLIEPAATATAAICAGDETLRAVETAHLAMIRTRDHTEFEKLDSEFHEHILTGTRNDLLREFHNILLHLRNQPTWVQMKRRSFNEDRRKLYCTQHQKILDALVARTPQAASDAMAEHLLSIKKQMG